MARFTTTSLTYASLTYILRSPGITVIETPGFEAQAKRRLSENERDEIIRFLSLNPDDGEIMPGTGGARKSRFPGKGKGKRGGFRVVYFYYNDTVPLFLLSVFAKNEKIDLSKSECNELKSILKQMVAEYRKGVSRHVKGR